MELACFVLANTRWYDDIRDQIVDRLDNGAWLEHFLTVRGLTKQTALEPATKAVLRELRALLRRMIEAMAEGADPSDLDLASLNEYLAAAPVIRCLVRSGDNHRLDLLPMAPAVAAVLGEIAASAADLLAHGERERIKICPGCHFAFYDQSKGRTRRWCNSKDCGNRDKVRRFREKHRTP